MEKDDEVKGDGNSYTTEFRQYDPRLGRWLSLDPLMAGYPDMSPFCAFNNNPVYYVDPLGLEGDPPPGAPGEPDKSQTDGQKCSNPEYNDISVSGERSTSSQNYKGWLTDNGGAGFIREVRQEIYEGKKNSGNNNNMGELVYGKNNDGYGTEPNYPDDLLAKWYADAEHEAIIAIHTMYAAEMSGIDPGSLWMYVPGVSAYFNTWMLDAASTPSEANWIKAGLALEAVAIAIPSIKGLKSLARISKRIGKRGIRKACFIAGTEIKTENGEVAIEDIKIGDQVWAFDEQTGQIALKSVSNVMQYEIDHLDKLIIGTDTIHTTDDHPFYVNSQWKEVAQMIVGDTLTLLNGEYKILLGKERIDTLVTVYNFTVEGFHTYFVGEQGVWCIISLSHLMV